MPPFIIGPVHFRRAARIAMPLLGLALAWTVGGP
jgi:hypothetical protein